MILHAGRGIRISHGGYTMASTDRFLQMDFDDLRWERYEKRVEEWEKSLHRAAVYRQIGQLINKYRPGKPVELHKPIKGGFNVFFRLEYEDGSSAGLRIPLPGRNFLKDV